MNERDPEGSCVESKSIDWASVEERLRLAYTEVIGHVKQVIPGIDTYIEVRHDANGFTAIASFCHDLAHAEFEDLLLYFTVGSPDVELFRDRGGHVIFRGRGVERDVAGFEFERGTGELIASLGPVLLPPDEKPTQYEQALLHYVDDCIEFTKDNVDVIIEAVRSPYRG